MEHEAIPQESFRPLAPPETRPTRRVGTLTMGLSLVAVGALLLAGQFGLVDAVEAMRWSPLILIFLGVEILICNAFNRSEKLRYDFLSMFVCFILIVGGTICSIIPSAILYDHNSSTAQHLLSNRLEERIALAVGDENIAGLSVDTWDYNTVTLGAVPTADELEESGTYECHVYLELSGTYTDRRAFAEKATEVFDSIDTLDLPISSLSLSGRASDGSRYELYTDRWGLNLSAEELALQVQDNILTNAEIASGL